MADKKHIYKGSGGDGREYLPRGSNEGAIFAYVRRSAEDRSIRPLTTQIEVIEKYAQEMFKTEEASTTPIITKYFGDNGVSGAIAPEKRDGLRALFEALDEASHKPCPNGIHIIVYDASRIARNASVGTLIKDRIDRCGGVLHLAQNKMAVTTSTADLFFGLNLQMAASERAATISRIRTTLQTKKDWDPRKSFGWQFKGAGIKSDELPEEQVILTEIKNLYEKEGKNIADITKEIQTKFGNRRCRQTKTQNENEVQWTQTDISFLSKKHNWVWGQENTLKVLEKKCIDFSREGKNTEEVFKILKGQYFDGSKVNRPVIRRFMGGAQLPEWKQCAINTVSTLIKNERFSNDDIVDVLNEKHKRPPLQPGGEERIWPRQTGWRFIKEVRRVSALKNT